MMDWKKQFTKEQMKEALEKEEFQVYYQPKYDLYTEMIVGAEALVRWFHPEQGLIMPGQFIPQFEKEKLILKLDLFVWERACQDLRGWMDQDYPLTAVSVNVSRVEIGNPDLPDILKGLLEKYQIPIPYFHLEITESAYTDNPEQIIEAVSRLRCLGFVIEMDDFGSGYSSLNMLAQMPVDVLKLDMKFLQTEFNESSGRGVLSFVISLAKWLNLIVIAEGVETEDQISSLRSMDCSQVQGFYFSKPMPEAAFRVLLRTSLVADMNLNPKQKEAETDKEETVPQDLEDNKRTLVIADDMETNRKILSGIFSKEYRIVECGDGKQTWEYLQEHYMDVEVIFLDLLMPFLNGFELLRRIRSDERMNAIPVIVTSQGDEETEARAVELGADEFIIKPYNAVRVKKRLQNTIACHEARRAWGKTEEVKQNRQRVLMQKIPGGTAIYHLKKDHRIETEYISEGIAESCGYSQKEFLQYLKNDARKNIFREDLPRLKRALELSIKNQTSIHEIQRIYTKDKKVLVVHTDAAVQTDGEMEADDLAVLYAVHTSVEEQKGSIIQEQIRYRYILDNLDVAFFELDSDGGFYASDKFSLYMISEESVWDILKNTGNYNSVHPDDLPILFEFFRMKESNFPSASVTLRMKMRDHTYRWTEMMGFFEYDETGKRQKLIGVLRDVDKEWIRQNQKLQEALDTAEKANRAKTDFLERVSHDMRTPLNGILGLTVLMRGKDTSGTMSEDLERLEESGKYLLNLINDTLDVSQIESGTMVLNPSVCDGKTALGTVITMIQPEMEKKHIYFQFHAEKLPFTKLYLDVGRVEQVILNVLSNAVKFTPEGGTIEMTMKNISQKDGVITDSLVIRDNGIGMSEEFQKHLFEPFSQERNNRHSIYHGTGLGMTITKQCMELMGGSISVKSREHEGTEVTLIIPMPIATPEQIEQWQNRVKKVDSREFLKGKRILLCEDHPLNAVIAMNLLEKKGMKVVHAENGKIGLEMFAASGLNYFDAVLMDIRMPEMDGLEATRSIRKLKREDAENVPIIAMTANVMKQDVKNAINAGMTEHLGKPVDPERLYRTLAEVIQSPHPHVGKTVLIVDDIEMNRSLIKKAISSAYQVMEASNGEEAMQLLKTNEIAAVITDIQMPGVDGKQLIQQIRANEAFSKTAIIANTIYGDHHQEDELLALGADDFIYKPASPCVILMRLEYVLRKR